MKIEVSLIYSSSHNFRIRDATEKRQSLLFLATSCILHNIIKLAMKSRLLRDLESPKESSNPSRKQVKSQVSLTASKM